VKTPLNTPKAPWPPTLVRTAALLVTLVFSLALTLGTAQAHSKIAAPATLHGTDRAVHGQPSTYVSRRVTTRTSHRRHHKPSAQPASPAPTAPAPESTPTTPAPAPTPTAEPTPAREPTPTPPPAPAPAPTPTQAPAVSGSLLFDGNFDAGFKGWYVQSLSSRATLFTSGAFQGNQAARFEVRQGDVEPDTGSQRSEVSGPTFKEGQDLYFRDAFRLPAANTYNVPWQIIQQLHEENWSGSPGIAVRLENNRLLEIGAGDGSPTFWRGPSLQTERWYDLVYRVKLSQDSSTGFVEVWLDGVQQTLANGQTRIYGQTMQTDETYLKAGIYRSKSSTGTSIVEHDAIVVGTSYVAVEQG
jgi:Polysaccharide lyase